MRILTRVVVRVLEYITSVLRFYLRLLLTSFFKWFCLHCFNLNFNLLIYIFMFVSYRKKCTDNFFIFWFNIYSFFNSDSYRTRRWWLMILPTIVIFISQGTSSPPWTRGLLLQCLPRILTATCAPLSMVNFVIQLISIGKCPTISAGESGLNTLIKNESYGLFFFHGKIPITHTLWASN